MDKIKHQRLEAAGWKIGDTSDFLELSPEEAKIIELKLFLSRKLKELRNNQQITQLDFAARMKSSQSRVAKIEAGDPSVSLDWLIRGLFCIGATKSDIAQLIIENESLNKILAEVPHQ
jgi:DNA-binding XRE family transcriptional regulator